MANCFFYFLLFFPAIRHHSRLAFVNDEFQQNLRRAIREFGANRARPIRVSYYCVVFQSNQVNSAVMIRVVYHAAHLVYISILRKMCHKAKYVKAGSVVSPKGIPVPYRRLACPN